ncbi:MAG TPA: TadE/TadG family type IV pilus assembly protein [Devosiaceae bacterium]|jgi:Flp pilus assembly protein TadG|nr:TadE/TadG family type IV pilus assembly protein [Devosiaceae bacterium]
MPDLLNRFIRLLERFRSDERGAFLVIFGVMAIVLVATSGAVVDFTSIEQARTRAQVALDSAALGLQPRIYDRPEPTEDALRVLAQNLLQERMGANDVAWNICAGTGVSVLPCVRVDAAETDVADGTLRLEASMELPMSFVSLVGVESMRARLVAEATRKRINIEVAMVLDNSGSMTASNRMGHLKAAAVCATNILLKGACDPGPASQDIDNVKIGIVPFTEFVNVGTANASASWMDRTGVSKVARDNFDNDDNEGNTFSGPINRFDIYNQMGVSWKGCVEARLPPYDTDDTPPTSAVPATLFAPALAPSEPLGFPNAYIADNAPPSCPQYTRCEWTRTTTYWGYGTSTNSYKKTTTSGIVTTGPNVCNCNNEGYLSDSSYYSGSNLVRVRTCQQGLTDREIQERICKYNGASTSFGNNKGPNFDCPDSSITPLTDARPTLLSRIGSMKADGGTNIHQGVMWGFHMLSPTEPLSSGVNPYDSATSKVMIVMTDGENTHDGFNNMNGSRWYVAYGYPYNERLGEPGDTTAELQVEMDNRTTTTCDNAKARGITIYTIGLSTDETSDEAKVRQMLTDCASSPDKAKFPSDPSELKSVFSDIADELSNLRLAQ